MTDQPSATARRDRSPPFPYLSLPKALERTQALFESVRHHEARVADVATNWGLTPKSSSLDRNVAALLLYGLIVDNGSGEARKIRVSETGLRILEDKRPGVREKLLAEAALKPKIIADYAQLWKGGRPDEAHSLSQLKFEGGFTDEGAKMFLRVFDETIRFTSPSGADSIDDTARDEGESRADKEGPMDQAETATRAPTAPQGAAFLSGAGEREWLRGPLSKETSYRLVIAGDMGPREIGKLIKLLQAQQAVLSDDEEEPEDQG